MKLSMRIRGILLFLVVCVVTVLSPAANADNGGVENAVAALMEKYGLDESNFSMGYYDPYTGEEWYYNADAPMIGGSVYKLPLCMMYEERVNSGELTMDSVIGGYTLQKGMYFMLVESNNDVAAIFEENLGTSRDFRSARTKYFGVEPEDLPSGFMDDNYFSARYSINMLRYLYENADDYPNVLTYMVQAQPGKYFRADVDEYEIAHKYGYFDGYTNDVGIVYTPEPYLLAVYTYYKSDALLGEICRAVTDYTLTANAAWSPPIEAAPEAAETPCVSSTPSPTPAPKMAVVETQAHPEASMVYIICCSAAALILIAIYGAVKAIRRKK